MVQVAVPGAPARAGAQGRSSAERPVISKFSATPSQLDHRGGKVRLVARTRGAARCEVTSTVKMAGVPSRLSCRQGHIAITVRVPGDAGAGVRSIPLRLKASGGHGAYAERVLYVHVLPRPPAVASFSSSPSSLPPSGGAVTLTARVLRALRCVISASPEIAGLPVSLPCADGKVAKVVALPPVSGGQSRATYFALSVAGLGGGASSAEAVVYVRGLAPTAASFTATPSSLPATGGSVTLSIAVTNASQCSFGYSWSGPSDPIAKGALPANIPCSKGTYTYKVDFAPDLGSLPAEVSFQAIVISDGGEVSASGQPSVVEAAGA